MANLSTYIFMTCVVLAATVLSSTSAQTFSCYSCNSTADARCNDPFTANTNLSTCTGNHCTKATWTVSGVSGVVRGCSTTSGNGGAQCTDNQNYFGLTMKICYCSTSMCNAATRGVSASSIVLTSLVGLLTAIMTSVFSRRH